jgi:hypothetical protein
VNVKISLFFEDFINEIDNNDYTSKEIKSPKYKPFLFLDGSYVATEKFPECK